MKTKLIFLLILGITFCNILYSQSPYRSFPKGPDSAFTNIKRDASWEFVKERLFDGSTNKVKKYSSDIRIKLYGNPTKEDSTIITGLTGELKGIISTVDVRYVKEKGNLVITFQNRPDAEYYGWKTLTGIGNNYEIVKKSRNEKKRTEIYRQVFARFDTLENDYSAIIFSFNDSISYADRKAYIEYTIVQSLCIVNSKSYQSQPVTKKGAILGKAYFDQNPLNTQFDQKDKFLLGKLYSADFQEQFKNYLIQFYSRNYYLNFVNKGFMQSLGVSTIIILTLLILLIACKPVFRHNFRKQYFNYLLPALVITSTFYLCQYIYLIITNSPPYLAWGILNVIIISPVGALILSSILFLVERYLLKLKMEEKIESILKVFLLFILILFPGYYLFDWTLESSGKFLAFCALAASISIGRGALLYIKYSEDLLVRVKNSEISQLKELKAKAEVQSLHSRVNPHFLYNSLNSIAGLAHSNPDKTEKMALSLSDLFRYTISRRDEQLSSIKDEIDMVRTYLEIEQIRFGERMTFNIIVDKSIENQQISRFIIQPLVENAIKHGISNIDGKGKISISVMKINEEIVITVGDNGPSFPDGLVSGNGLQSLYDLLNLIYGDKAKVNWQNTPDKQITVTIPQSS